MGVATGVWGLFLFATPITPSSATAHSQSTRTPGGTTYRNPEAKATAPPEMETEAAAARQAKESLELAFQMSQILDTGLDRHTLSLLMALCDRGANPEALAALVRELSSAAPPTAAASTPLL